jgi:hypothetical protein
VAGAATGVRTPLTPEPLRFYYFRPKEDIVALRNLVGVSLGAVLALIDALVRPARPGGRAHSGTDQGET